MYASRPESPEELWRRIAETMERMEEKLNLLAEKQQCIEQALQQKPDRDEVENWVSWSADELKDNLSNVASILAGEDELEHGISGLQYQIEDLRSLIEDEFEDLKYNA